MPFSLCVKSIADQHGPDGARLRLHGTTDKRERALIMSNSRRQFLMGLSATLLATTTAPAARAAKDKRSRLPIAFSTLGCPNWEWNKILAFASQNSFAAIELRGLEGNLDLPTHAIFAPDRITQTKREILASQLKIACVSSSANLYHPDPATRAKELADARRFIDLAKQLGA